jgi:hypothetical protein
MKKGAVDWTTIRKGKLVAFAFQAKSPEQLKAATERILLRPRPLGQTRQARRMQLLESDAAVTVPWEELHQALLPM